ncbi:MAG TPA: hypothetical protein PLO89_05370, partial [Spirochaetota bacterium]|nr:hypothetical protein [Spirochaetota bacterium]
MIKKTITIFIIIFGILNVYSDEFKDSVDKYILEEDYDSLTKILSDSFGKENYSEAEALFFDKAKSMIFAKEYKKARKILEVILFVNFENNEAQELFISVGNIISQQEAAEKKKKEAEEKKRLEEEEALLK